MMMGPRQAQIGEFSATQPNLDLSGLPKSERQAYASIELEDTEIGEFAEARGIEPSTARTLIHRARRKLGTAPEIGRPEGSDAA